MAELLSKLLVGRGHYREAAAVGQVGEERPLDRRAKPSVFRG